MTLIELTPIAAATETEGDCCPCQCDCEPGCKCGGCPCCE